MAIDRTEIEKLWKSAARAELARTLAARRTEWSAHFIDHVPEEPGAAALALLTLAEDGASGEDPLVEELASGLIQAQCSEGSWGGPGLTALVMRALSMAGHGQVAYARGLAYLSDQQHPAGNWSRSDTDDSLETAFVLSMLGDLPDFQGAVDVESAVEWRQEHAEVGGPVAHEVLESTEKQWGVALQRLDGMPRLLD
jgi:hypothetical protein